MGGISTPSGATGQGAYTTLTATLTQPAIGATVTASVQSSLWMAVGQTLYIAGGGYYSVSALPSQFSVTLVNLSYSGNSAPGSSIGVNANVVCTGSIGPQGPMGNVGATQVFATYAAALAAIAGFTAGQVIFVAADETHNGVQAYYQYVTPDPISLSLDFVNGVYQIGSGSSGLVYLSSNPQLVAFPANSSSPGAIGQIAVSATYFAWYTGTQWLRASGSTF